MDVEVKGLALTQVPLLVDLEDSRISRILLSVKNLTILSVLTKIAFAISDTQSRVGMDSILNASLHNLVIDLSTCCAGRSLD